MPGQGNGYDRSRFGKSVGQKFAKRRGQHLHKSEGKEIIRGQAANQFQNADWDKKQSLLNEMRTSMTGIGADAAPLETTIIKADNPHSEVLLRDEMKSMYNNYVRGQAEGRAGWDPNDNLGMGDRQLIDFPKVFAYRKQRLGTSLHNRRSAKYMRQMSDSGGDQDQSLTNLVNMVKAGRVKRGRNKASGFDGTAPVRGRATQVGLNSLAEDSFDHKSKFKRLDETSF